MVLLESRIEIRFEPLTILFQILLVFSISLSLMRSGAGLNGACSNSPVNNAGGNFTIFGKASSWFGLHLRLGPVPSQTRHKLICAARIPFLQISRKPGFYSGLLILRRHSLKRDWPPLALQKL